MTASCASFGGFGTRLPVFRFYQQTDAPADHAPRFLLHRTNLDVDSVESADSMAYSRGTLYQAYRGNTNTFLQIKLSSRQDGMVVHSNRSTGNPGERIFADRRSIAEGEVTLSNGLARTPFEY
jgi:hypothetical protein